MTMTLESLLEDLEKQAGLAGIDKQASDESEKEDEKKKDDKDDEKSSKEDESDNSFAKSKEDLKDSEKEVEKEQTKEAQAAGADLANQIMQKVASLQISNKETEEMNKQASEAGKALADALLEKLANAGDQTTVSGIPEGVAPTKNQIDAAAQVAEPVQQGLVSMTGTFFDTIIICTITGLVIVLGGTWNTGLQGYAVTKEAFCSLLPFINTNVVSFTLMLCLVMFAFTTILGWDYYSERCLVYLSGGNMKHVKIYRWIYILAVFIGPYMTVSAVWTIADIFNGLMALPNMIALFALSGVVVKETKSFFERHNNEKL
jgi:hypothetical protein